MRKTRVSKTPPLHRLGIHHQRTDRSFTGPHRDGENIFTTFASSTGEHPSSDSRSHPGHEATTHMKTIAS
ncbi:hypothetical protein Bca4012_064845 [Brassica carinata]